ncbi:protein c-terminal s-isoprenylcysteine carboxyl o-methyltransferase [Anaeramoeba flamelloides]|uniref:Protein c-terminal s-isoprenylcysteine carboxyl o-methyltransferase n=1 Tax=Anaeramoeba flamelloides TaxID=1746091 RepID=A0ABQ8XP76_9EUKA|nr:protein c-terminal s-isoprenylcysteine carboxyl o-methyltransferase [Anaeramoeba flamelloides]
MIWFVIVSIIYLFFNYLRILTGFDTKYYIINQFFIHSLKVIGYSVVAFPQPRFYGCFDLKFPSYFYLYIALCLPYLILSIRRFQSIIKMIKGMTKGNAKPEKLTTNGPFAECRHPLYGTIFLMSLSGALATGAYLSVITYIIFLLECYYGAKREEDEQLVPLFKHDYVKYRNKVTNMFFNSQQKILLKIYLLLLLFFIGFTFYKKNIFCEKLGLCGELFNF